MKIKLIASFVIILISCFSLSVQAQQESKIIILHTNDVHTSIDKNFGYAGVAAYKKQMQKKYGNDNVLLVDAGDAIQGGPVGSLTQGAAIIDIMNAVGYDFMTLGNHEFDYGLAQLNALLEKLQTKVISCNISYIKDAKNFVSPFSIVEIQGLKLGFVGITTPETLSKSIPANFQDKNGNYFLSFAEGNQGVELYNIVQKNVDLARSQGADIIIALAHLGMDNESSPWHTPLVVANTSGIDVVIDGHSHTLLKDTFIKNKDGKDVIVTQTGSRLQSLGKISIDPKTKKIIAEIIEDIPVRDAKTQAAVDSINDNLAVTLEKNVGTSVSALTAANAAGLDIIRMQETNLANLVTDAFRTVLEADVALINAGGIRNSIDKGPITFKEVISVLPFGGDGVLLQVSGQTLLNALEMGAMVYPKASGGLLHVSGVEYSIDPSVSSSVKVDDKGNFISVDGPYRVKNVLVNGYPLELSKKYSVAGTDFILRLSGDGMTMFKNSKVLKDKFMVDNEIVIAFIQNNLKGEVGNEYANLEGQGRITILKP